MKSLSNEEMLTIKGGAISASMATLITGIVTGVVTFLTGLVKGIVNADGCR